MTAKEFKRLKSILEGDGADIRRQFILAGLLLTIFERFKTYVVGQVDGFFAEHTSIVDGELRVTRGEKFKELVKANGRGQPGQHGNATFRAAMRWVASFEAIDAWELEQIERLYALRNEIGHELMQIVADDRKVPITVLDVITVFHVYVKVVRWWVSEIEMATDPDMTEEKWAGVDRNGIESFDTILLREMMHKALAGTPEWEEIRSMVELEQAGEGT